ncbi:RNA polymerase sigma factor [Brevibacillus sp. NPDC058079]|uniref:RNA polymerase sigma factor n=1 Tax=Brevibacillus sp. NPDC058079 TaxID=3346330 RepID=UPI0036EEDF3A
MNLQQNMIENGNDEALSSLLKEVEPFILRIVSGKISNQQDVLDITQEVLVRVYRNLHKYDPATAKLTTWVGRITRNLCIDYYRRQRFAFSLLGEEEMNIQSRDRVESSIEKKEFSSHLSQALNHLSNSHRKAFIMRHLYEKSYDEIAMELRLPLNTVKSHIHRARLVLREFLGEFKLAG